LREEEQEGIDGNGEWEIKDVEGRGETTQFQLIVNKNKNRK
jgi:hypothetical protein